MSDVTEDSLVVPKGSRGRPKVPEPGHALSVWLPETYYNKLAKLSLLHDVSMSKLGRRELMRFIDRAIDT